ncbi:Rha family transcriptional regulator [Clostridium scatologenes]|uniref:Phage regulatory protein n=1 Tax=Clostridium scatologenes TaxID=1548 RepID=A0A0E3JMU2_CLOSL|nr:Rha family transcriptional regulator [Clostridium scatologenes]AKA68498.1 phage regulatory protein [Clostridium scatologenes]
MKDLIPTEFKNKTIKSTELVEVVNQFRKAEGNKTELRHDNFMDKIKKEIETLEKLDVPAALNFKVGVYLDKNNQSRPCFELNRDGMLQMLNSESTYVRYKTIEYINMLEDKLKQPKPTCIEDVLIQSLQEMKDVKKRLDGVEKTAIENKQEVQAIRDTITLSSVSWRKDTSSLINKMALNLGGYEHIRVIREESYKLLNERMGVDVKIRLTNKRRRMADEGVCKSKRDKLTVLDVIQDDKKLIEGYVAIIKEMTIKYKAA